MGSIEGLLRGGEWRETAGRAIALWIAVRRVSGWRILGLLCCWRAPVAELDESSVREPRKLGALREASANDLIPSHHPNSIHLDKNLSISFVALCTYFSLYYKT